MNFKISIYVLWLKGKLEINLNRCINYVFYFVNFLKNFFFIEYRN